MGESRMLPNKICSRIMFLYYNSSATLLSRKIMVMEAKQKDMPSFLKLSRTC